MVFDPTNDENDLLAQMTSATSMLMGWFALNIEDAFARSLYYGDIPSFYIWENSHWRRRVQTKVCGYYLHCVRVCVFDVWHSDSRNLSGAYMEFRITTANCSHSAGY